MRVWVPSPASTAPARLARNSERAGTRNAAEAWHDVVAERIQSTRPAAGERQRHTGQYDPAPRQPTVRMAERPITAKHQRHQPDRADALPVVVVAEVVGGSAQCRRAEQLEGVEAAQVIPARDARLEPGIVVPSQPGRDEPLRAPRRPRPGRPIGSGSPAHDAAPITARPRVAGPPGPQAVPSGPGREGQDQHQPFLRMARQVGQRQDRRQQSSAGAGRCGARDRPRTPRDTSRPPRRAGNAPRTCGPRGRATPGRCPLATVAAHRETPIERTSK